MSALLPLCKVLANALLPPLVPAEYSQCPPSALLLLTGMLPGPSWPIPTSTTRVMLASACDQQDRSRWRRGECQ